jgi:hypothetical protein
VALIMAERSLVAAAGLAEAAWSAQLFICWICLLLIAITLLVAWRVWSRRACAVAMGLSVAFGVFFTPWAAFQGTADTDPDVVLWSGRFRAMAVFWLGVLCASLVSLICIWRIPRHRSENE